jgi:alkylation response protein AidB-like acyl-CoA dehydrogenase
MDFDDTADEAAFRAEARAWLEANAQRRTGRDALSLAIADEAAELVKARVWQAKKAAAGYAELTWPTEYGGRGGTPMQAVIYAQEEAQFDVPQGFFPIGLMICVPILMHFGRPEHCTARRSGASSSPNRPGGPTSAARACARCARATATGSSTVRRCGARGPSIATTASW